MLNWGDQFRYCVLLSSNQIPNYPFEPFENLLAVGNEPGFTATGRDDFSSLQTFIDQGKRWLVGHFSYDLRTQIEALQCNHSTAVDFPLMHFFEPAHLIFFEEDAIKILSKDSPEKIYQSIANFKPSSITSSYTSIMASTSQEEYIETVQKLIKHIENGDMYEINYCISYLIRDLIIDPVLFYNNLCKESPTPFSFYYKLNNHYALGASPERFLKKNGPQLISQPIKGTAPRGKTPDEDQAHVEALKNSEKEQAENMMIVDLVRNDLARSAKPGSVCVEEIFGIYPFQHWHQMISTVSAQCREDIKITDIIKNAFPMGSMTGAPKIRVMELIEQYENFKRGLYSGAIGYITPQGDFDFNVVIRSLFYDRTNNLGSLMAGSAITYDAIPEKEYEECILKANTIIKNIKSTCTPSLSIST